MPFSLTHNPIPSYTRPPKKEPYQLFFIRLISIFSDFINGAFKFSTPPGRLDVACTVRVHRIDESEKCREIYSDMEVKAEI